MHTLVVSGYNDSQMRWTLIYIAAWFALASTLRADPKPAPVAQPTTRRTIVATTGPVAIPYELTDTNHILVRLKINGKGPFHFIVDTGAPVMILRESAAQKLGLKTNARGYANLKQLEIEGGMVLKQVQCLVDTPYQIEGMNAMGATRVDLDGLLGYAVLAHFRMQIDLSEDHMVWTPINFTPPPFVSRRLSTPAPPDKDEDNLESLGGLLKVLGPLIKPVDLQPKHRGLLGLELRDSPGVVSILRVLGNSPAEKGGALAGDQLVSVNQKSVQTTSDAQRAMSTLLANQPVTLLLRRGETTLTLHLVCSEGL